MEPNYNVKHNFNLKSLSIGDYFLGCPKCWFRYDVGTFGKSQCPECRSQMKLYDITKKDKNDL